MPDTVLARTPQQTAPRRRRRQPKGPGERIRVREILSYLAATLPESTPAAARLLALQCALRMNASMRVRLARGLLRSLRLDSPDLWHELEQAGWLYVSPASCASEITAELLDVTLLDQAPARPDRAQAADWALRIACLASAQARVGPLLRLTALSLTAHTAPGTGAGKADLDQLARACGTPSTQLPDLFDQLVSTKILASWQTCHDMGDLTWHLWARDRAAHLLVSGDARTSPGELLCPTSVPLKRMWRGHEQRSPT
ncbi:hypothetical protein [Streptomyces tauricus]|uniref:hypothetical protein n=1 Tax=Streptomyces tauricus TaxID=68274 RepID=UPI0033BBC538